MSTDIAPVSFSESGTQLAVALRNAVYLPSNGDLLDSFSAYHTEMRDYGIAAESVDPGNPGNGFLIVVPWSNIKSLDQDETGGPVGDFTDLSFDESGDDIQIHDLTNHYTVPVLDIQDVGVAWATSTGHAALRPWTSVYGVLQTRSVS